MQISFGKRPSGHGFLPMFNLSDWKVVESNENTLIYKPSAVTLFKRLIVTALCALALGGLYYYHLRSSAPVFTPLTAAEQARMDQLKEELAESARAVGVTQEEIDAIGRENEQRKAATEAKSLQLRTIEEVVLGAIALPFALTGLLAPLTLLSNRLRLRVDSYSQIVIESGPSFWRKRRILPIDTVQRLEYGCKEVAQWLRNRRGVKTRLITEHYWQWFVRVHASDPNWGRLEFFPVRQSIRPGAQGKPPTRVIEVINFFYRLSKAPVDGPLIMESAPADPGTHGSLRRVTRTVEPIRRTFTVEASRLDDFPPEIRDQVKRALADPDNSPVPIHFEQSERITVRDAKGNEQTYERFEDLPPEYQEKIRKLRGR